MYCYFIRVYHINVPNYYYFRELDSKLDIHVVKKCSLKVSHKAEKFFRPRITALVFCLSTIKFYTRRKNARGKTRRMLYKNLHLELCCVLQRNNPLENKTNVGGKREQDKRTLKTIIVINQ